MIVVCDTGPLTHLWQIGLLPAFVVFDETHLPVQVVDEVQRHVDLDQLQNFTRLQIHTVSPTQVETVRRAQPQGTHLQVTDLAVLAGRLYLLGEGWSWNNASNVPLTQASRKCNR